MHHIISVLVENKFGVLARIAGLFSGRGFNIDTLNVAPTHTNGRSRITATLNGDEKALDQISRSRSRKMRAAPDALGPRCPPSGHDRPPQGR